MINNVLRNFRTKHRGKQYVRTVRRTFRLGKDDLPFVFLVYNPMGSSLSQFCSRVSWMLGETRSKMLLVFLLKGD